MPMKLEGKVALVTGGLFLAGGDSSHITGTPVWIDGGQSLMQG